MKQCKVKYCSYPVFGKGYCKFHQYMRNDLAKPKTYTKRIKPVSDKRSLQMEQYLRQKDIAVTEARKSGTIRCFACNKTIEDEPDWHHTDGRVEEKLLDFDHMVFMHRNHHDQIHHLPVEILMKKEWYQTYLNNLKAFDIKLYEREYEKRYKLSTTADRTDTTIIS